MNKISDEVAQKWFDNYFSNLKDEENKINKIMSSTFYIKWLLQFTENTKSFYIDNSDFHKDRYKTDLDKIEMLNLFYEGINNYAKQNYLYPIPCDDYYFGNYYNVKFNKYAFEIGHLIQGNTFYCNKVPLKDDVDYIDLYYIMIGKKHDNVKIVEDSLESLTDMIKTMYENGVPIQAITDTFNSVINNISALEDNKKKQTK